MRTRIPGSGKAWGMLLWRHLSSILAGLGLLYSGYVLLQMLVLEATVPRRLQPLSPANSPALAPADDFMLARNIHLRTLLDLNAGSGESLKCPLDMPVLQVLDHSNAQYRYIPCPKLMYNRVPKCGSRTLISVFKVLGKRYNFTVEDTPKPSAAYNYFKNITDLNKFVSNFSSLAGPLLYTRHLHYVNFTKFGRTPPLYINVIRDPMERLISHYSYNQYGSKSKPLATPRPSFNRSLDDCVRSDGGSCFRNTIIPFFCGHDHRCRERSQLAVQKAKRTVRESYQVVGITEDLPAFIEVLENLFPQYFFNASEVYREKDIALHKLYQTVKKPAVSEDTKAALKDHLSMEYDFYRFCKQRFYTILTKIRFMKRNDELEEKRVKRRTTKFNKWWETV